MRLWLPLLLGTHNSATITTLHCVSTAKLVKSRFHGSGTWRRTCVSVACGKGDKKGACMHAAMKVDQKRAYYTGLEV